MSAEGAAPTTTEKRTINPYRPFLSGRRTQTLGKGPTVTDHSEQTRAPGAPSSRPASPFRLNLEQQRKRAKDLQDALRKGSSDALLRFHRHHPKAERLSDAEANEALRSLNEAQLVIARELGLPSWPKLKAHILAMQRARHAIAHGDPAPDGDIETLHIRCGSDIKSTLDAAKFRGDFLEYSDALCQGPVVQGDDWLERRASFLMEAYGAVQGRTRVQINNQLKQAEAGLRNAAKKYERVVLWFEHDSYDQLVLVRCLAQLAEQPPHRLELISVNNYPGAARFIGLGQLPPEALRLLWQARQPVSHQQLVLGRSLWTMVCSANPTALAEAARSGTPELPDLAPALRRHCQELPWTTDGLGLTERLVLELLAERPRTVNDVFSALMLRREPLPWLGDLMLLWILENMKRVSQPVLIGTFEGEDRHWARERLTITELGRSVLAGQVDWLSLRPPTRWLGGVCVVAGSPCWRWDDQAGMVVLR